MSTLNIPDFLASEKAGRGPRDSFFHVIPVPLERSVSYGSGTRNGPKAILEASQQLEAWDGESVPLELGIHTERFVNCSGTIETVLERIEQRTTAALKNGKIPVLLGGEHTASLGALQAVAHNFREPIGLFQLDAHADLRESYEGDRFSHACVARRAHEDLSLVLFQFGVRALCREEQVYRQQHHIPSLDGVHISRREIDRFEFPPDFPDHIYVSLDVDGLDPSVIRSTGTPVPGGPGWYDTLAMLAKVIRGRRVVGFDIVELSPRDEDHSSSFAAALLTYSVMGLIQRLAVHGRSSGQ